MLVFDVFQERALLRVKRRKQARNAYKRITKAIGDHLDTATTTLQSLLAKSDADDIEKEYRVASDSLLHLETSVTLLRQKMTDMFIAQRRAEATEVFKLHDVRDSNGRFGDPSVILADPPWESDNPRNSNGTADQYDTMSDEAICALPVGGIAGEDCSLLLWTTFPKLESAFRVMAAWGFKYQTVFTVWIKIEKYLSRLRMTSGVVTRPNGEIILVGTRGNMRTKLRTNFRRCNVLLSRPQRHSQKPEVMKQIAVELYGDKPRMEIFSRTRTLDWRCWGNEVGEKTNASTEPDSVGDVDTDAIRETRVCSEPESKRHASAKKTRRNNLDNGAFVNLKNQRMKAGPTRGNGGKLKAAMNTLGYFTPHNCIPKNRFAFYSDGAGTDDSEIRRETFVQSLEEEEDDDNDRRGKWIAEDSCTHSLSSIPLKFLVTSAELARTRRIDDYYDPAEVQELERATPHPLYTSMTNREVAENIDAIYEVQRSNSDKLFVFNYNAKGRRPVYFDEK